VPPLGGDGTPPIEMGSKSSKGNGSAKVLNPHVVFVRRLAAIKEADRYAQAMQYRRFEGAERRLAEAKIGGSTSAKTRNASFKSELRIDGAPK
jgi:hypothetical protein